MSLISWLQSPSAVILEPKKIKSVTVSIIYPSICHEMMGPNAKILVFWMLSFKPTFPLSSFTFIKRLFSSSSLSAIRVTSSPYLRLLIFLPAVLIPACASSSLAFHTMYSAYKLNKPEKNVLPWGTHFQILKQSIVTCLVVTVTSWPAYRFLRRQVKWSTIPKSLRIFHPLLWFTVKAVSWLHKSEGDVSSGIPFFFYDPADVGNLISGSSAILKSTCTSGSFWFMYYWSLAWRILSITLLAYDMSVIVW